MDLATLLVLNAVTEYFLPCIQWIVVAVKGMQFQPLSQEIMVCIVINQVQAKNGLYRHNKIQK